MDFDFRHSRNAVGALLFLCVTLAAPLIAAAEPSAAERETARSLMLEGDRLRDQNQLEQALERYRSAHAIMAVPTTGLAVAKTQIQLGLLVEASSTAMQVFNLPRPGHEPQVFEDARNQALQLAASVEPRVPALTTVVTPAGTPYSLHIDEVDLPEAARSAAFKTNPGKHVVRVEASGYVPETREVELIERDRITVTIALSPIPTVSPAVVAETVAPAPELSSPPIAANPSDPAAGGRLRGSLALVIGGVALASGLTTGALSWRKTNNERAYCEAGHCDDTRSSALSSANTLANVANICVPLGLLSIGYGLFELLTLPRSHESARARSRVQVAITPAGALLRGEL